MPPIRHSVARHDAEVISEEGAFGTTSDDHVPLDSRYSPTVVGSESDPVVPRAMHEPESVQALVCSGTEMLIEGKPVTCSDAWVAQLASARAPTPSNAPSRHAREAFATSRLIEMYAFV